MKRLVNLLFVTLLSTLAVGAENSMNYFTMGENDTLRIPCSKAGGTVTVPVDAHFLGDVQQWRLSAVYPTGFTPLSVTEGPDMTVHYLNENGEGCIYPASIIYTDDFTFMSCIITVTAYIEHWGSYVSMGLASWPGGDHKGYFSMTFMVSESFTADVIDFEGVLIGNNPLSGVGPSVQANSQVTVVMTPDGDIDCNGVVNISDVTALINRLLSGTAGSLIDDVNGDDTVNIADVTALIDQLLNRP
jgi:hypothetical protein